MKIIDRIRHQSYRLLTALSGRPERPLSFIRKPAADGSIPDGIEYALPPAVNLTFADTLPDEQRRAVLKEASARDTFQFQFDIPQRTANDMPFAVAEDPLREWNWSTRSYVLTQTHNAYHRNPLAKRGVKYVASFVTGQGFNLMCHNKEVETLLQDFIDSEDNAIREYEAQAVIDLVLDGELLNRYYTERGLTVMVPYKPFECQWIDTEPGFYRRPVAYRFQRLVRRGDAPFGQQTVVEDIPAANIQHVTINRHSYELRGRPELYDMLPWLRAYKEWLENRARQNHWRGALLWWVKLIGARPETVASKGAQYSQPPTPGSIVVTTDKEEWQPLVNPGGGADAAEDGRQIKLMTAVSFGLPEYFLGDGSNANRATSQSQQLPALTTFSAFQRIMIEHVWYPMFRRVLQNAIDYGLIPDQVEEQDSDGETLYEDPPKDERGQSAVDENGLPLKGSVRMVETVKAFDVSYEPIGGDADEFTLAQAMQIQAANGWISDQTASEKLGNDWGVELKRKAREQEEHEREVAAGKTPAPVAMRPQALAGEPIDSNQQADSPESQMKTAINPAANGNSKT